MAQKAARVRNWRKYNQALVTRGSITFWFDEEALKHWHVNEHKKQRGRPKKYSDLAITCGLTLKTVFHLPFRGVIGFIKSLVKILKLPIEVPDYSLLCKRQKTLSVSLSQKNHKSTERLHVLVDSTGLKLYGEGEWKVRQHGHTKKRTWRKLHLAVNAESQEIEALELTDLGVQDCQGFKSLINQLDQPLSSATGDGAYDRFSCYELGEQRGFQLITPPQRNARTSKERTKNRKKASPSAVHKRDEVIEAVRAIGRKDWKRKVGYHRRSLAETAMFRLKTILRDKLQAKKASYQALEVAIWCRALNKMTSLGFGK